jgi:peptide/nickel transport system substrate-binding protein
MYKTFRYWFWVIQAFVSKHALKLVVAFVILAVSVFGIFILTPYVLADRGQEIFIEGVVGTYTLKKLPPEVLKYLSIGIIEISPDGTPVPRLAETIQHSADGREFTITLKENVRWHNDSVLTSADLTYTLPDVQIERPDSRTMKFTLKEPFAPFLTLLTSPLIKITRSDDVVGLGEYKINKVGYSRTQFLTELELISETRRPRKILLRFFPTEKDAIAALKVGKIDSLKVSAPADLTNWKNLTIYKRILPRSFVGIYFNIKDPVVGGKDPILRQALSMATPKIEDEIHFDGPFAVSSWAYQPSDSKYAYNIEKAREALARYNKISGKSDLTAPTQIKLTFTPKLESVAEFIKEAWAKIGVEVTTEPSLTPGEEYQAFLTIQDLPADPDQYSLWHSTQSTNISNYNNARVDRDLERGRRTMSQSDRLQGYVDFQKIIREELPVLYLYHDSEYFAVLKKSDSQQFRELKGL